MFCQLIQALLENNGFCLYPSLNEVGPYMDNLSIDNITNLRGLADKLIKSSKFAVTDSTTTLKSTMEDGNQQI